MTIVTSPSRPALSVIVPNYHHSPYLKERLDSIINQSFQDFELIVLDDASTDNSLEVIKATLGNRPYRLEVNEQNSEVLSINGIREFPWLKAT